MKIKKCKKTVTGKHIWENIDIHSSKQLNGNWYYPKCIACGLVDDRIKKLKEKRLVK